MIIFLKILGVLLALMSLLICTINPILGVIGIIIGVALFVRARAIVKNDKPSKKDLRWEQEKKEYEERFLAHVKEQKWKFEEELSKVPLTTIKKDPTNRLTRNALSDMEEIRFRAITKTFNPDTLPSFVIIDTETTGLSSGKDRIVELSAIAYEDFVPVRAFSTLVNPKVKIPEQATEKNGITDDDVTEAPTLEEIAPAFVEFIGRMPIVGYNTAFDLKFLWAAGVNEVFNDRRFYDALALARKTISSEDIANYKLLTVADYYDIYFNPHKSLNDCFATGKVFEKLIEEKAAL